MIKRVLLFIVLFPLAAHAEATGGYGYSFGSDVAEILFVGVLVLVAIIGIIIKIRKGRK